MFVIVKPSSENNATGPDIMVLRENRDYVGKYTLDLYQVKNYLSPKSPITAGSVMNSLFVGNAADAQENLKILQEGFGDDVILGEHYLQLANEYSFLFKQTEPEELKTHFANIRRSKCLILTKEWLEPTFSLGLSLGI